MAASGELIDISVPLRAAMPVWPGSPGFRSSTLAEIGVDSPARVSRIDMEVHTGTHVDAPCHFLAGGSTVERLPLDALVGPAEVAACGVGGPIGRRELERLDLPPDAERLLLKTPNSRLWSKASTEFQPGFAALSLEGARWVVERGLRLFGIDYLSVQRFADGPQTHRVLLAAGVVLLEGLDLSRVEPGCYELLCLPILLPGLEAAPARAVLRPLPPV